MSTAENAAVVERFLRALEAGDLDAALALLDDDVVWINVSLPAVRGKRAVERICRWSLKAGGGFRVHFHAIAQDADGVVLTERADALTLGRFEQRFWVYGRFELRDGRITVWRDAFDWRDLTASLARGLAGVAAPGLNRAWPPRRGAQAASS
jgi:limonene-1,2-epoxide hydrolase